jgi:hypothetical protein
MRAHPRRPPPRAPRRAAPRRRRRAPRATRRPAPRRGAPLRRPAPGWRRRGRRRRPRAHPARHPCPPLPAAGLARPCAGPHPVTGHREGFSGSSGHREAKSVQERWAAGSMGCSELGAAAAQFLEDTLSAPLYTGGPARERARAPGSQGARPKEVVRDGWTPQARSGRGRGRSGGRPSRQRPVPLRSGLPRLPGRRGRRRRAGRRERRGGSRAWLAWRRLLHGRGRCVSALAAGRLAHICHSLRSLRRVALPPSGTPSTSRTRAAGHPRAHAA